MERIFSGKRGIGMNSTGIKRVVRTFWAWQEDKESKWLEDMSRKGWHLEKVGFFNYTFREGPPRDYVYRFDFKVIRNKDVDDYKETFKDSGWENIGNLGSWFYFRGDRSKDPDMELYNDNKSKIEKYKRLLIFLVIITGPGLSWVLPNLYMRVIDMQADSILSNPVLFYFYAVFVVIFTLVEIIAVYGIIRILMIINRLKKDIRE